MGPQCQYPTSTSNINDENNNEDPPTSNDGSEFFDCRLNCLNVSSKFSNFARSSLIFQKKKREREREVAREQHCIRTDHSPFCFFCLTISRGGNALKARKTRDFCVMFSETTRRTPEITWLIVNVKKDGSVCKFSLVLHVVVDVVVVVGVHVQWDLLSYLSFLFYFLLLSQHL